MIKHFNNLQPWLNGALLFVAGYLLRMWSSDTNDDIQREGGSRRASVNQQHFAPPPPGQELKMVLIVNDSLKMGKGKIAAQCAHAAVGIIEHIGFNNRLVRQWEHYGSAKIALKANNLDEMYRLAKEAQRLGLPTFMVADAGRTQIAAGSRTVLAIGPGPKDRLDQVTGHLKLL